METILFALAYLHYLIVTAWNLCYEKILTFNVTKPIKFQRNVSYIPYIYNGNEYRILIKTRKGPSKILGVVDELDMDVVHIVQPFMGPSEDFHKYPVTPQMLGFRTLKFIRTSGSALEFHDNEIITI